MSEAARINLVDRAPLTEKQQNVYESIMQYPKERERIARNGIESCKRFETDKIIVQWVKLIESL